MGTKRTTGFMPNYDGVKPVRKSTTVAFGDITEPGAYYCHDTGWLFRITEDSLAPGHSPVMDICTLSECLFTKISEDTYIPVNKARQICANWDFAVNF